MNPIRDRRQHEIRKYISNSLLLDIGAGSFPISQYGIKIDIQKIKKPHVLATTLELPILSNSIDVITSLEIIEHLHKPEQLKALSEYKRILKSNGKLIVSIPNSSSFMAIPQRIVWYIREHTTQAEYHHNRHTHTHIGLITPNRLVELLEYLGFTIIEKRRLILYDYFIVAKK